MIFKSIVSSVISKIVYWNLLVSGMAPMGAVSHRFNFFLINWFFTCSFLDLLAALPQKSRDLRLIALKSYYKMRRIFGLWFRRNFRPVFGIGAIPSTHCSLGFPFLLLSLKFHYYNILEILSFFIVLKCSNYLSRLSSVISIF